MTKARVTVIDIAKAAGVSKSTVSLVLQGSSLVNEGTRSKVNAVMRELGYVYNRGAANLRQASAKSRIIGVVVNDLTNSFFAELAVGVDMVVQSAGFVQFLSNTSESIDRQREVVASMREHGISGLIVSFKRAPQMPQTSSHSSRQGFRWWWSFEACLAPKSRPSSPTTGLAWCLRSSTWRSLVTSASLFSAAFPTPLSSTTALPVTEAA